MILNYRSILCGSVIHRTDLAPALGVLEWAQLLQPVESIRSDPSMNAAALLPMRSLERGGNVARALVEARLLQILWHGDTACLSS